MNSLLITNQYIKGQKVLIINLNKKANNQQYRPLLPSQKVMISQSENKYQDLVKEMLQKTKALRTQRQILHTNLQQNAELRLYDLFNLTIKQQWNFLNDTNEEMKTLMINQISERQEIYDFQLQKMLHFLRTHYLSEYPRYKVIGPLRKINKLSEKFLTAAYDFTNHQIMGLLIYSYTYDWQREPNDHDFGLFHRIIKKLMQFNHFDDGYQMAFEQIMMLVLILYELRPSKLNKISSLVRLMKKFQIIEISTHTVKHFYVRGYVLTCTEILDINIMILAEISRNFVLKNIQNSAIFPEVLNQENTKIMDELGKKLFDFVPQWFHLMHFNNWSQIHILVIQSFVSLSKFQRKFIPKISFINTKYNPKDISYKLSPFEKQLAGVLYNHQIINWISLNIACWTQQQSSIQDVISILQLLVLQITVIDFKEKLIPVVQQFYKLFRLITSRLNWLFEFVYVNKKPQNTNIFRDIFIERRLLFEILMQLEAPIAHLEENLSSYLDPSEYDTENFQDFIFKTMLAIEITRACEIAPQKLILQSAEVILKLQLNCYWMNEFMEKFLNENPLVANEKMEIQT